MAAMSKVSPPMPLCFGGEGGFGGGATGAFLGVGRNRPSLLMVVLYTAQHPQSLCHAHHFQQLHTLINAFPFGLIDKGSKRH